MTELIMIERKPAPTHESIAMMVELFGVECEEKCWHSSCWMLRDLRARVEQADTEALIFAYMHWGEAPG